MSSIKGPSLNRVLCIFKYYFLFVFSSYLLVRLSFDHLSIKSHRVRQSFYLLQFQTIIQSDCILRGDLANVRIGRQCVISKRSVIRPPFKKFSKGFVDGVNKHVSVISVYPLPPTLSYPGNRVSFDLPR